MNNQRLAKGILLFSLLAAFKPNALALQAVSSATFRGPGDAYAQGVAVDKNGNVYVVGYVNQLSAYPWDVWVAKYDSSLVLQSSATFNDSINYSDFGFGIAVDDFGNVYVTGMITTLVSGAGRSPLWVAKYNSSLVLQTWNQRVGPAACVYPTNGRCDWGYGIAVDKSGNNIYPTGTLNGGTSTRYNYLVERRDPSLALVNWVYTSLFGFEVGFGVTLDPLGNVYTGGYRYYTDGGQEDIQIYKYDSSLGQQLASRRLGGNANRKDAVYGIAMDPAGDTVYVTGNIEQPAGDQNIYIGRLDTSLNTLNEKLVSFGTGSYYPSSVENSHESGQAVAVAPDGTVYVSGYVNKASTTTGADIWIAKYDPYLTLKASMTFNGPASGVDYANGVAVDKNGDAYVVGSVTDSDGVHAWIGKFMALRAPSTLSAAVQGVSSITWSWSDVSGETGYQLVSAIDQTVWASVPADTVSYTETGLVPNTLYRRRVKAFDAEDVAFSTSAKTYTLAAVPSGAGVTSVLSGSATFFWSANGNPDGTLYRAEQSADGVNFAEMYAGTSSSVTVTGLLGGTRYYFRVRAQNGDGLLTSYSDLADTDNPQVPPPPPPPPGIPTVVTVSGRQLRVDGALFTVKGVDYQPTPVGQSVSYDWSADIDTYNTDIPLLKAMGANAVRLYKPPTQNAAMDALRNNGIYVIMGYPIDRGVDLSDPDNRAEIKSGFVAMVNAWKNHPAVMMWCFGNELNREPNGKKNPAWYSLLQEAAAAAKAADPNHPVTTANAHLDDIGEASLGADDASLPALDLWGANLYRGADFTDAFTTFASSSTKPLILLEWGRDAYNGLLGKEDQTSQSNDIAGQWAHISNNLSLTSPSNVCVGGVVFEYSDEWWKRTLGDQGQHNTETDFYNVYFSSPQDPNVNEEWWGLVAITPGRNDRNLRQAYYTLRTLWGGTAPVTPAADILPIYSDLGHTGWEIYTWPSNNSNTYFDGKSLDAFAEGTPEGQEVFKTTTTVAFTGWGVVYDSVHDLSAYQASGALRFWIRTSSRNTLIQAKRWDDTLVFSKRLGDQAQWNDAMLNQWTFWEIDLAGEGDMSSIKLPFMVTLEPAAGTFYVDKVSYVKSKASPLFNVSLRNRSDNLEASSITWNVASLPAGWIAADQYVRVDMEPGDRMKWGLQIYTDNKGLGADPLYTGAANTNPAGLIDTADTAQRLPLAWRAVDRTTGTLTIVQSADNHLYSQELGGEAGGLRAFHWMSDASTPDIPLEGTAAFANGVDAVMVWDNEGFHYAEGDRGLDSAYWGKFWGAVNTPVYIYLGAKFSTAVTPREYKTNVLRVEFFAK